MLQVAHEFEFARFRFDYSLQKAIAERNLQNTNTYNTFNKLQRIHRRWKQLSVCKRAKGDLFKKSEYFNS